jgi:hypothetical protein
VPPIATRIASAETEQGLTPLPPEQQRLNIPVPDFGTTLSSSPGNPAPLRSMLPLDITPDMYVQRYHPDAPHFERSFPMASVTARYNAAQALTMQAASVSSPTPLVRAQTVDELPDGSTRKAVTAVDATGRALVDLSQAGHLNKTVDYIPDGTTYVRTTPNQRDGGGRGYTYIGSTGRYTADKYHLSAYRTKSYTDREGSQIPQDTWQTVQSYTLTKPEGATTYKGSLLIEIDDAGQSWWTVKSRLEIAGQLSGEIQFSQPAWSYEAEVTVTGIASAEAEVNVNIQLYHIAEVTVAAHARFRQWRYEDEDGSMV